jgi:TM2 domain-containing membrane protein YozV
VYKLGIAYVLWLISGFGALGFHRFYLGKIPTGLLWMMTGGLGMFGSAYDFLTLPRQVEQANLREELRRALQQNRQGSFAPQWRYAEDAGTRVVPKESLERTILRVAKKNSGIASVSDVALQADISMEDAKSALDLLVTKGFAELRVRQSGSLAYTFPEFMDADSPLEDF